MNTIKKLHIKYETATGLEAPSLREVGDEDINSRERDYDYVLRGEVEGWGTTDFTISDYQLEELQKDVRDAQ